MRELADILDEDQMPDALDEYQGCAMEFAIYPGMLLYPALGLASEAGEVADKVKKLIRDDEMPLDENYNPAREIDADKRRAIALEIGDCLFYCAALADDIGYTLSEIADMNIAKLEDRAMRGKLQGSGDYR